MVLLTLTVKVMRVCRPFLCGRREDVFTMGTDTGTEKPFGKAL